MTGLHLWLLGLGVILASAAVYVTECALWPFARCWCCRGTGRHTRADGQVFRDCRVCRGGGRRIRVGRRAWNLLQRHRRAAR